MQATAQGWLILQLTDSAFYLGLVSALGTLPVLLLSLFGGAVADRIPKRKLLFCCSSHKPYWLCRLSH
jgi:MFS family permease